MRILQLSKYFPPAPGGIESFVGDISRALTAQGHDNLVLAHRFENGEPLDISGDMGRVIRVPSYGEMLYAPIAPGYPLHLRQCLRDFKPDMLLIHMPNVSGFWPLFLSPPCPLIVFWHADVIFPAEKRMHRLAYGGYSHFERALLKRAAKIIVTSPPYLEYSAPLQPFRSKCEVIPLAINTDRIPHITDDEVAEVKHRLLGDSDAHYVYSAGRFAHYKGFDRLMQAASQTRDTLPDLKYVIAGDGETRTEMLRLKTASGLDGHVFLPGRVTDHDYWALMKGCSMFCLPSIERTEAFGVVLLEAMAMGKPCISTDIQGSGTGWVNRNYGGIVVSPDSPGELAQAVKMLSVPEQPATVFNTTRPIDETARAIAALGHSAS